jgi:hypothetical protein
VVHGAVRSLFQLLGALVAGLVIALSLFAWRLSSGPIQLDFLTPYIEDALTAKDGSMAVKLGSTVLAMGNRDQMLELKAVDVKAVAAGSDLPLAMVPEMALSLNGHALLAGELVPNSVRLRGVRVHLIRDQDGKLLLALGQDDGPASDTDELLRRLKDALMGDPDPSRPGRHLQQFAIRDADLLVEDRANHTTWHAPETNFEVRRTKAGLKAEAAANLDLAGEKGLVQLSANYNLGGDRIDASVRIGGIRLAALSRLGGPVAQLDTADFPLSGSLSGSVTGDGKVLNANIDLSAGEGWLRLPVEMGGVHRVAGATLRARAEAGLTRVHLDEASLDLGGPRLTLAAELDGLALFDGNAAGPAVVNADGALRDVPVDQVRNLWPDFAAPGAREWVLANMTKGMIHDARVTVAGHSAGGRFDDFAVDKLSGDMSLDGVQVNYLSPMPPVHGAAAHATFDASEFRIALKDGEVWGLRVKEGSTVVLGGLDKELQTADIDLSVAGPTQDAMKLIDSPPLRYAQALGLDPSKVGGSCAAKVRLKFPLIKALKLDELQVKAHASLKALSLPKVLMGQDLTRSDLELDVDAKGLDATGAVYLGGIPAKLEWRENFSAKAPMRSRFVVNAPRIEEDQRRQLGLDTVPFVSPFIAGPVGANVVAVFGQGGKREVDSRVDLAAAKVQLPGMGWKKEPGKPGNAEVSVLLDRDRLVSVPRFTVNSGDLNLRGSVGFDGQGAIRKVEFQRIAYGRTDGEGTLSFRSQGGGLDAVFKGVSLDAQPFLSSKDDEAPPPGQPKKKSDLPPMAVQATVKTMWLSDKGGLSNAQLVLSRDASDWRNLSLRGTVGEGKSFTALMQPASPKRRTLQVHSDDAGAVAQAFDVYDHLVGGQLDVDAYYDDAKDAQPLEGTLRISDYQIVQAPALARLLTVAALTGVVDLLRGQGVSFTTLDMPFTLTDGLLEIRNGRAYGPALGLTAKGQVDMDKGQLALEGTVVPAYALNSALGNIPVLGWLFTGGEKGGGIVAFNYGMKGPSADPSVTVNPLSALTPGFLRNLFNIFDDGSETDARKKK